MDQLGSAFPKLFQVWFNEIVQYETIDNWLDLEAIDGTALFQFPILSDLSGWRNCEVRDFISGPNSKDWTASIFQHG